VNGIEAKALIFRVSALLKIVPWYLQRRKPRAGL